MDGTEQPKLIAGNSNMTLAKGIVKRMSIHRGTRVNLVNARVERFSDQEIFVEVFENLFQITGPITSIVMFTISLGPTACCVIRK